ncbi:hypothetical protein AHAS_Ahas02G0103300 [Arachis hypogaea]
MTWLRNKVSHIPPGVDPDIFRKYVRFYLMMLMGEFLFMNKSATLAIVLGSALLAHTYHSLCTATGHDVTDIVRCMPLVMSWIYHWFPSFCLTR